MTELPYRSEHVNDAIADTEELSNEELGAYVRLQRAFWRAGGYLPAKELGRFARAGKRWGQLAPAILRKLTILDGLASSVSILELLLRTRERRAAAVDKARKGGLARASSGGSAVTSDGTQNSPLNAANPLESHNVALLEARPEASLARANQNQNHIDSKNLSAAGTAAGLQGEHDEALYRDGVAVLMERVKLRKLAAASQLSRWLAALGNADEVTALLVAAVAENLDGVRLIAVIDQRVKTLKSERERGPPLRLGFKPNVVPR